MSLDFFLFFLLIFFCVCISYQASPADIKACAVVLDVHSSHVTHFPPEKLEHIHHLHTDTYTQVKIETYFLKKKLKHIHHLRTYNTYRYTYTQVKSFFFFGCMPIFPMHPTSRQKLLST